jgi:uncharacterized damage-inducible protein DinB
MRPITLLLIGALAAPAAAQQAPQTPPPAAPTAVGFGADLMPDLVDVERKVVALARAIPADKYAWRPAPGVRSIGEVFLHVAADNDLLPTAAGHAADPETGIRGDDYRTALTYERRRLDRDATIAALERSFAHLERALASTTAARFAEPVSLFGRPSTVQRTWIVTATHLHEHLGQLIAYARTNGVTPPWTQ